MLLEEELYYRTIDGVLLRCLDKEETKVLMGEIYEGVCGSHQSAYKMKWMIRRNGNFWPTMLEDCFTYYKGCQGSLLENEHSKPVEEVLRHRFCNRYPQTETIGLRLGHRVFHPVS